MSAHPRVKKLLIALLATLGLLLGLGSAGAVAAPADADFTQGVTALAAGSVQVWFTPTTASALVDVHYLPDGGGEQDFRMADNGGTWQQTVNGLGSGSTLEYWFTYEKNGPLYVTPHYTYVVGSGGGSSGGGGTGSFPITFQNNTGGAYSDAQVYVTVLGQVTAGQWSYMKPDGTMAHINHLDATAPGHLTKNGVNYPNMSFTLAQSGDGPLADADPRRPDLRLARLAACTSRSRPTTRAGAAPTCNNPADPNSDVYYDWYEYTYRQRAGRLRREHHAGRPVRVPDDRAAPADLQRLRQHRGHHPQPAPRSCRSTRWRWAPRSNRWRTPTGSWPRGRPPCSWPAARRRATSSRTSTRPGRTTPPTSSASPGWARRSPDRSAATP